MSDLLIIAQLKQFRNFLIRFKEKDEKLDKIYESGEEPTKKETREFEKLKKEYKEFLDYFKEWDGNYWGGELSVVDVAKKIEEEVYG